MERLRQTAYVHELEQRAKKSRVYTVHQARGLEIAELLNDNKHKSLYIKLAKEHNPDRLLRLAKSVVERKNVKNAAAYFMKLLKEFKL